MFFDDHSPPHFHAVYGEYKAAIKIDGFILTEGYLPPRVFAGDSPTPMLILMNNLGLNVRRLRI
ncbi:MAG: DUF4160 domain-containing protein [Proteobacteria bacterium]|nr:DUF4160 domain-containing protein [Pseudomonadota bacterium]